MLRPISRPRKRWFAFIALVFAFILALYPKPSLLYRTIQNLVNPPIRPNEVAEISNSLPNDPVVIENWVFDHVSRDANDYRTWGVYFYFASPSEVLAVGRGACYVRAIVLASILQSKSIPYKLYLMPGHVWVDYPGRVPHIWGEGLDWMEHDDNAILRWEDANWHFQRFGWLKVLPPMAAIHLRLLGNNMPLIAKGVLCFVGIGMIGLLYSCLRQKFGCKMRIAA